MMYGKIHSRTEVSVVLNVHEGTKYQQFKTAANSILDQKHKNIELIIVISDAPALCARIRHSYGKLQTVNLVELDEDDGLSAARNAGAETATGDVVVFTDDDIIAEPDWIGNLIAIYEAQDPVGVGGNVVPVWPEQKPWYLPSEFFWLVGVMHDTFVDEQRPQRVRNTFGCNILLNRTAFLEAGGFRVDLGKNSKNPLQGEEAELLERLDREFWYAPDAVVHHVVDPNQLRPAYLFRRSFWQGYSKAALTQELTGESSFLIKLLTDGVPRRFTNPSREHFGEASMMILLVLTVGLGFLYGRMSNISN